MQQFTLIHIWFLCTVVITPFCFGTWIKQNIEQSNVASVNGPSSLQFQLYSKAEIPTRSFSKLPEKSQYYMFYQYAFATVKNFCNIEQVLQQHQDSHLPLHFSCDNYFCHDRSDSNTVVYNLATHVALHNFCLYCASANNSQFLQKLFNYSSPLSLSLSSSCSTFIPFHKLKNCAPDDDIASIPLLSEDLVSWLVDMHNLTYPFSESLTSLEYLQGLPIQPNICYCTPWNKYGYKCDLVTHIVFDLTVLYRQIITLPLNVIFMFTLIVTHMIPECVARCNKCRKAACTCKQKCNRLRVFGGDRLVIVVNLVMGVCIFFIHNCLHVIQFTFGWFDFPDGLIQIIGAFFIFVSYLGLLIQWIKISEKIQRNNRMHLKHKFVFSFTSF